MDNYTINFSVDGQPISEEEIHDMELSRYHHVFKIFNDKNIEIKKDNTVIPYEDLLRLPLSEAKEALAQTRESIGKEKTLELFKPEITRGDEMWTEIANNSREGVNMQEAYVDVEVHGISLVQFMMFNQLLAKENNLYTPSKIHPEHYYFDADKAGNQVIIETFGMYKDPSYLDLKPGKIDSDFSVQPKENADIVMAGNTFLKNTGLNTKMLGMHQLSSTDDGMKIKLGVLLPEGAPKEIAEGHKWHLMVEFNNGLHIAAQQHPSFIQKKLLETAIHHMANKNK